MSCASHVRGTTRWPARGKRARSLAALAALALALTGASPCSPASICRALREAGAAPPDADHAAGLGAVWERVEAPYRRHWGWPVSFVPLPASARMGGAPLPPQAAVCGGAEPRVYASAALWSALPPLAAELREDVVAFVLAHELAHRVNDFHPDGRRRAAGEPGAVAVERLAGVDRANAVEALADKRAAFLVALAGYSPTSLRDGRAVDALLASLRVPPSARAARRAQLDDALRRFEEAEWAYGLGTALAIAGEPAAAAALLDRADDIVAARDVPVPELRVARAVARVVAAAPEAMRGLGETWAAARCELVLPSSTALVDPATRRTRGVAGDARQLLREALALLEDAAAWGADPLAVAAVRGCAALYLGNHDAAAAALERALTHAVRSPEAVRDALARNAALAAAVRAGGDPAPAAAVPIPPACAAEAPELAPLRALLAAASGRCPPGAPALRSIPAATGGPPVARQCDLGEGARVSLVAPPGDRSAAVAALELVAPLPRLEGWACRCRISPQGAMDSGASAWQAVCGDLHGALEVRDGEVIRAWLALPAAP